MNDQNSQFEKDQQTEPNRSYSYVFSNGEHIGADPKADARCAPSGGGGGRGSMTILAMLLAVSLCFGAGFGGSYLGNLLFAESEAATSGTEELFVDDPDSVIDKTTPIESVYGSAGEDVFAVSQVVRMVQDAVVVIRVQTAASFGSSASQSSGSGVVISSDGYVLTCNHVVESATSVQVTLNSGEVYDAALVGSDAASDLAVLKISPEKALSYVEQGCSGDLVVGERVVAIGNPLGTLGGTVTDGIVSATERSVQMSDGSDMTLIQTNAAINSGNSGGGLFNLKGQLIGIVNAKYSASGVEGLAFAIPIDSAYPVQKDLIQYGYVRGVVDDGLTMVEVTAADLYYYRNYYYSYGITEPGIYITGSAYSNEIQSLDRLIAVGETAIETEADFDAALAEKQVGDTVTLTLLRNGKTVKVELTLEEYVPERLKDLTN